MTNSQGPLIVTGKLKDPTDLCGRGKGTTRVAKMHVYLSPSDMLTVMDAIGATTAADLQGIGVAGNWHGRCLAAICRAFMANRGAK